MPSPRQSIELKHWYGDEDLEIYPLSLWFVRSFFAFILGWLYHALTHYTAPRVQLFIIFCTVFFGAWSYWGVLWLLSDPQGTHRHEQIDSQPLRSIECAECDSVVGAQHLDCPNCGAVLR